MGVVVLPRSLTELFPARDGRPALPRRVSVFPFGEDGGEAVSPTVGDLIEHLDRTWPGLRDRLCEPGPVLRAYINVYVDGEPASIDTPVPESATVHVLPAVAGG